jgi:hypothetical protein
MGPPALSIDSPVSPPPPSPPASEPPPSPGPSPVAIGAFSTSLLGTGADAIKDAAGNALGGGSGFGQALKVLWGDINDDGVVNSQDLVPHNNARAQTYNVFCDAKGDGAITTTDVTIVRSRNGTSQP